MDFNCHHPLWDSRGTFTPCGEEVFDWVISSDFFPLNDPDTTTLLHRSSLDIFFGPSSLALSCSWEVLHDLDSGHLPIFLSVSLSPIFPPTSVPLPSIFRKLTVMTLPSALTPTDLLQRNTRLFLFPLLLLSSPLWHRMRPNLPCHLAASNALLKHGGLLRWKVWLVKDARLLLLLTEVMKITRFTSPLFDVPRLSLPRPRMRHGRRLALLFHPNQTQKLYTLLCFITGSPSSSSFSPNFPICSSSRELALVYAAYLRSHFSVSMPEATFLSSVEPRALRSLTHSSALFSLPLNFL